MKYVPIKAVLNFISTAIQEEEKSENQLISWAFQALRLIDFPQKYENKVCFLEIKDHKATLPVGWREISDVRYMYKTPCKSDIDDLHCCFPELLNTEEPKKSFTSNITYGLYVTSSYFVNNFRPLYTKIRGKGIGTNCCKNDCKSEFTIKNNCIYTDFREGIIQIKYQVEYQENGEYMIPDDVDLMRGISEYIKYQHWEGRSDRHEQGTLQRSEKHLQRAEILLKKSKGKFLLRSLDMEIIEDIQFGSINIIKTPLAYNRRNYGY